MRAAAQRWPASQPPIFRALLRLRLRGLLTSSLPQLAGVPAAAAAGTGLGPGAGAAARAAREGGGARRLDVKNGSRMQGGSAACADLGKGRIPPWHRHSCATSHVHLGNWSVLRAFQSEASSFQCSSVQSWGSKGSTSLSPRSTSFHATGRAYRAATGALPAAPSDSVVIVFDFETTGLKNKKVIEVGCAASRVCGSAA